MNTLKKIGLLILVSLFLVEVNQAQDLFVGGSLSLTSNSSETTVGGTTTEGPTTVTFGLNPRAGYYLSEDLVVGGGLGWSTSKTTIPGNPEQVNKSTSFSINPFARYYLMREGDFAVFGEGGLNFGFGSSETTVGGTTNDGPSTNSFRIYVTPMLEYNLTDRVSMEAGFGSLWYNTTKTEQPGGGSESKSSSFNLRLFPNSINFGVKVFL